MILYYNIGILLCNFLPIYLNFKMKLVKCFLDYYLINHGITKTAGMIASSFIFLTWIMIFYEGR